MKSVASATSVFSTTEVSSPALDGTQSWESSYEHAGSIASYALKSLCWRASSTRPRCTVKDRPPSALAAAPLYRYPGLSRSVMSRPSSSRSYVHISVLPASVRYKRSGLYRPLSAVDFRMSLRDLSQDSLAYSSFVDVPRIMGESSTNIQYTGKITITSVLPFCRATSRMMIRNRGRPSGSSSPAWIMSHSCQGSGGRLSRFVANRAWLKPTDVSGVSSRRGGVQSRGSVLPNDSEALSLGALGVQRFDGLVTYGLRFRTGPGGRQGQIERCQRCQQFRSKVRGHGVLGERARDHPFHLVQVLPVRGQQPRVVLAVVLDHVHEEPQVLRVPFGGHRLVQQFGVPSNERQRGPARPGDVCAGQSLVQCRDQLGQLCHDQIPLTGAVLRLERKKEARSEEHT